MERQTTALLILLVALVFLARPTVAFGAGNIASISAIEGQNWRHGDIEDLLKTVAFLRGQRWTSMMIKRAYFGNWLRDYSQAVDVGTLKGVQADTIRVLVWVLSFMSFGYATLEFEVTAERLGVYRPEEHIDNPKDYADNVDARQYDQRLRGPVMPVELAIDPNTGMKNYIANESGGWATSLGYIKFSFARSIHFGRLYTHGAQRGREEDLCEALRCLGQGLHCLEDFGAHTNYTELALRELGFLNVFPHVGTQTMINLHGKQVFPLVTGTFGGVDFLHSVLGEATDHVTQTEVNHSEVEQLDAALSNAQQTNHGGKRSFGDQGSNVSGLTELLGQIPGTSNLVQEAQSLQAASDAQAAENERMAGNRDASGHQGYVPYSDQYAGSANTSSFAGPQSGAQNFEPPPHAGGFSGQQTGYQGQGAQGYQDAQSSFPGPPSSQAGAFGTPQDGSHGFQPQPTSQGAYQAPQGGQTSQAQPGQPGAQQSGVAGINVNIDPQQAIQKIYPMLAFRDKVVRSISGIVSKIPGLEKMIETISEKVTLFVMGLLAPFVKPIIAAASNALKQGSGTVVAASQKQQYIVWDDPTSSDPTHSLLSKDHFSNVLNQPAGQIAAAILQYAAPRVIWGWEHTEVQQDEIMNDIARVFHHPAARDPNCEIHRSMFGVVEKWVQSRPDRGQNLNELLSSESVRAGRNHQVANLQQSVQGFQAGVQGLGLGTSSHSATAGGPFSMLSGGQRGLDVDNHAGSQGYEHSMYPQQGSQDAGGYQQSYEGQYDQQSGYQQQGYQQGSYESGYSGGNQYAQGGDYGRY